MNWQLKINYNEVGSSTMPQKINPINFRILKKFKISE